MNVIIEVCAVSYQRFGEMQVFVQSVLNQTYPHWKMTVIHDGEDANFKECVSRYNDPRIQFLETPVRYNDYGHTLRDLTLKAASGDFVILTNADNYFIPKAFEFIAEACGINNPDVVMYDMIHSHNMPGGRPIPAYSFFETHFKRGSIDITAAAIKLDLAKAAGFRDKSHDGDATYFEDVGRIRPLKINKIKRVLVVHN